MRGEKGVLCGPLVYVPPLLGMRVVVSDCSRQPPLFTPGAGLGWHGILHQVDGWKGQTPLSLQPTTTRQARLSRNETKKEEEEKFSDIHAYSHHECMSAAGFVFPAIPFLVFPHLFTLSTLHQHIPHQLPSPPSHQLPQRFPLERPSFNRRREIPTKKRLRTDFFSS